LGVGLEIEDRKTFVSAYRKHIASTARKYRIGRKRTVFDSYSLIKLLGGEDASRNFYQTVLDGVRDQIGEVYAFFTLLPPSKLPRLYVYEERTEIYNPVEFLRRHKQGYVPLCAWKYSEIVDEDERAAEIYLDFFQAKRTRAWDSLQRFHPSLFFRGDTCNPCVAMADGVLALLDRQLKRNFYTDNEKVGDRSIKHALRDLSLEGHSVFIGQPDLRRIIPYSQDQAQTSTIISHPIFFIYPERRPRDLTNQEYREMLEYMPIMDDIVERACEAGGCVKFYDATEDYLFATPEDYFVFYGEAGREMYETVRKHIALSGLDLSD
jgi:hypothetical protein